MSQYFTQAIQCVNTYMEIYKAGVRTRFQAIFHDLIFRTKPPDNVAILTKFMGYNINRLNFKLNEKCGLTPCRKFCNIRIFIKKTKII